jgi:hypothetical protein
LSVETGFFGRNFLLVKSRLIGLFLADFSARVKYVLKSIREYASFREATLVWSRLNHNLTYGYRCSDLGASRFDGMDWRAYSACRRIRLYWTLFGRGNHFFTQEDAKRAEKPQLEIGGVDQHAGKIRIAVLNSGGSVAKGCYGKITINHTEEDVIDGINYGHCAYITPQNFTQVDRGDVCWARGGNPARIDVPVGRVPEMLEVAELKSLRLVAGRSPTNEAPAEIKAFVIPSEGQEGVVGGWINPRVVLRPKNYTGTIFVGADNLEPIVREFVLIYVERDSTAHLEIRAS